MDIAIARNHIGETAFFGSYRCWCLSAFGNVIEKELAKLTYIGCALRFTSLFYGILFKK